MQVSFKLKSGESFSFQIPDRSFTIGRSQSCRIAIPSVTFSRQHCLIEVLEGKILVTDTGSSNGVFINGKRIPVNVPTPYHKSEALMMGDAEVTLQDANEVERVALELHTQPEIELSRYRPKTYNNPIAGKARRGSARTVRQSEETEKAKLFDPVNIVVFLIILGGILYYRQKTMSEIQPNKSTVQTTPSSSEETP